MIKSCKTAGRWKGCARIIGHHIVKMTTSNKAQLGETSLQADEDLNCQPHTLHPCQVELPAHHIYEITARASMHMYACMLLGKRKKYKKNFRSLEHISYTNTGPLHPLPPPTQNYVLSSSSPH